MYNTKPKTPTTRSRSPLVGKGYKPMKNMANVKSKERICSPKLQEQTNFNFASTQIVKKQKPTVKKFLDRNNSVDLKKIT